MGIVFSEMSSWTALPCHTGMKTVLKKNEDQTYEKQMSWNFITKILEVIDENAYLKKYST